MAIVSAPIPNFINGVSQQPFALRLASQAAAQENGLSAVAEGLLKRPGTKNIAKLREVLASSVHVHLIQRDKNEQYVALFGNGTIQVFDFDGTEYPVSFPDGTGYLGVADASSQYSTTTVADFTFVVNKTVVAQKDTSRTSPDRPPEALVWVKQGGYAADYSVTLDGTEYKYTTPNGSTAADAPAIQTNEIAKQLDTAIGTAFDCQRFGSVLWIRKNDLSNFTIKSEDSLGDLALLTVKDFVQDFTSLPTRAVNGFQVTIQGSPTNAFDTYYVQYDDVNGPQNEGVWKEVPLPGRDLGMDKTTMPHSLVRLPNGTFEFRQNDWLDLKCGDPLTNPHPSFTGKKVSDIFFFRNRLGFIADENVVLSKSGEFFNLYRQTVTDILDDDPIDLSVSHVKVSLLRHAIPFADSLLLFSDQTQFTLSTGGNVLTPVSASVTATTEFEASLQARPVGAGRNVYFAIERGDYSGIREYYVDGGTETNDANDVTSHVRAYIPKNVFKIAASTNEDTMLVLSRDAPNKIFVYRWFLVGQEKKQSSWSVWNFDALGEILNVSLSESSIWLVVRRPDGVFLERMDIQTGQNTTSENMPLHLDRQVGAANCTLRYDSGTKKTTITLPFAEPEDLDVIAQEGNGKYPTGYIVNHERVSDTAIKVVGDWTSGGFIVGRRYVFRFRFSPILLRDSAPGGGQVATTEGRLQITFLTINYADSGYFRCEVTPFRRPTYAAAMSGRVVGSFRNPLGTQSLETGVIRIPVVANNLEVDIDLINDSPLPCRFLNAEWEGRYTVRSVRRS